MKLKIATILIPILAGPTLAHAVCRDEYGNRQPQGYCDVSPQDRRDYRDRSRGVERQIAYCSRYCRNSNRQGWDYDTCLRICAGERR